MFNGTMAKAADYDLTHEDPDLERILPRSALGRPLETWSIGPQAGKSFYSKSTMYRTPSDRSEQESVLRALGLPWDALSTAATCRVSSTDPIAVVQARRFRGATEASLRSVVVPADAPGLEIGGAVAHRMQVRVNPVPALQSETPGHRVIRGDTVFDIEAPDDDWLADVVDQLVTGPRSVLPSFDVTLPDGWVGVPIDDAAIAGLASRLEATQPETAARLRAWPPELYTPSATFLAFDLDPAALGRFPTRGIFVEYLPRRGEGDDRLERLHQTAVARSGAVPPIARRVGAAGEIASFIYCDPEWPNVMLHVSVVRGGPRSLQVIFQTLDSDGARYLATFDGIVDSISFASYWTDSGRPRLPVSGDSNPQPDETIEAYLERVDLMADEGCAVVPAQDPRRVWLEWRYARRSQDWTWRAKSDFGDEGTELGRWRLDGGSDVDVLAADIAEHLAQALALLEGDGAAANSRGLPGDCGRLVERLDDEGEGTYFARAMRPAVDSLGLVYIATADADHRWPVLTVDVDDDEVSADLGRWRVRRGLDLAGIGEALANGYRDRFGVPGDIPLAAWWRPVDHFSPWAADEAARLASLDPVARIADLLRSPKAVNGEVRMMSEAMLAAGDRASVRRRVTPGEDGLVVHWEGGDGQDRSRHIPLAAGAPCGRVAGQVGKACREALALGPDDVVLVAHWSGPSNPAPLHWPARDESTWGLLVEGSAILLLLVAYRLTAGTLAFVTAGILSVVLSLPLLVPVVAGLGGVIVVRPVADRLDSLLPVAAQGEWPGRLTFAITLMAWVLIVVMGAIALDVAA